MDGGGQRGGNGDICMRVHGGWEGISVRGSKLTFRIIPYPSSLSTLFWLHLGQLRIAAKNGWAFIRVLPGPGGHGQN